MKQLAIVIPAYKATFLDAALASIAAQTCKDFTLYIGNDCSPHDISGIVSRYRDKIDLVYKRFPDNLGGSDLVAQWERCIDMTQGEPWLWLFSDDDVMEPRCVEEFYKAKKEHPQERLFHFDIAQIDAEGKETRQIKRFPTRLSAYEYLDGKLHGGLISFVVEFVFHRDIYRECSGFQNFDLAWGSDMITWVKFADAAGGMFTVDGARVMWRSSDENISPNVSREIIIRKKRSEIAYCQWIKEFLTSHGRRYSYVWYRSFFGGMWRQRKYFSTTDGLQLVKEFRTSVGKPLASAAFRIYWIVVKLLKI